MKFVGQAYQEFRAALMSAFNPNTFEQMLLAKMEERLHNVTMASNFPMQIHDTLQWVDMADQQLKFLTGVREWNPTNADLQAFAQKYKFSRYNFASSDVSDNELETLLNRKKSMLKVALWRQRLGAVEVQTCQVKLGGQAAGSGFLIGKQVILTNYHVIEPVLKGRYEPNQIDVLFDYKVIDDDGSEVTQPGIAFKLADGDEWKLCDSPYSDYDTNPNSTIDPDDQHLDFALLKLAVPVGDMPVGETVHDPWSDAPKRGWVESDASKMRVPPSMEIDDTVFVFQHPKGDPLSLDFDEIMSINPSGTRIRYQANTEGGSSGSGCYDRNFNLIALHHLGARQHNQGIPIVPIRRYIEQHGQLAMLS